MKKFRVYNSTSYCTTVEADRLEVSPAGDLVFYRKERESSIYAHMYVYMVIASGKFDRCQEQ